MNDDSRIIRSALVAGVGAIVLVTVLVFVFFHGRKPQPGGELVAEPERPAVVKPEVPPPPAEEEAPAVPEGAEAEKTPQEMDPAEAAVMAMLAGKTPDDWEPLLLDMIMNGDERTVAALAEALRTERRIHQLVLISRALCGIGTEESLGLFMRFLDHPRNTRYREFMAGSLLGLDNEELSGDLIGWVLRTEDYDITMACQEAIGRLALPEAMERIVAEHSRTNRNEYVLEVLRASLANSECPEAIDLFADVLENPPERYGAELQAAAAEALARIGSPEAIDLLVAALEESPRDPAGDYLVEAVALLHQSYEQAYLQELFEDATSPSVRYALGLALAEALPMMAEEDLSEPPPHDDWDWPEEDSELEPLDLGEGEWEPEEEPEEGADDDNPFADVPVDEYGYPVMVDEENDPDDPSGWGPRIGVD